MPVDVVKTRRQAEMGELQAKRSSPQTSFSTFSVMKSIMRESGVKGLFAGYPARMMRVAPACAIMISTYEFGKAFFRKYNEKERTGLALYTTNN